MATKAGSIGIGVEIDASDLASELTRAVEKSLAPALKKIDKMVSSLTKELDDIDGDGFKKVAQQAGKAEDAIGKVTKEQKKLEQEARSGGATKGAKRTADAYDDVARSARKAADATKDIGKGGGGGAFLDNIKGKLGSIGGAAKGAGSDLGEGIIAGAAPQLASLGTKGGPIGLALAAAAALGVGAGVLLAKNVLSGLDRIQGQANVAAKLGLTPEQMKPIAKAASAAYAGNFGDSVAENLDSARAAIQSGLIDPNASSKDTQKLVEQLNTVSDVMGEEIPHVARAASQAIKTGLAKDATGAFDLFVKAQQSGLNVSEDFIDTITEYGTQFRQLGLEGPEALGLIKQAVDGGARDTDKAADALKEFAIRAVDGSKTSAEAYEAAGLSAEEYTARIAEGGDTAKQAFGEVLDAVRSIEDPVQRNKVAVGLFGTQAEDLGKAIGNLDLSTAVQQFGAVEGAAKRAADTMGGTAAGSLEQARRTIEVSVGKVQQGLGAAFAPALSKVGDWVSAHSDEILDFLVNIGEFAIRGSVMAVNALGGLLKGFTLLAQGVGDTIGFMLKGLAALEDHFGDPAVAASLREDAEAAFSFGEGVDDMVDAMLNANADKMVADMRAAATAAKETEERIESVGDAVIRLPSGEVVINDNAPDAEQRIKDAGLAVEQLPDGKRIVIDADTANATANMETWLNKYKEVLIPVKVKPTYTPGDAGSVILPPGGRADGGVLPGYSPGVDNMLVPMSGGEGVIIPEAMRALGGGWLYDLNSRFRSGLSRRGYGGGGVVGFEGGGVVAELSPEQQAIADSFGAALAPVVGLLGEMRDMMRVSADAAGRTADSTGTLAADSGDGSNQTGTAVFYGSDAAVATPGGRIEKAVSLAKNAAASGGYSYGGVGGPDSTLYDCSGLMSDLYAVLTGQPYTGNERYFTTESNFPGLGFVEGYNPASPFNVGIRRGGGGPNSHIAGKINGTNVEAGGGTGGIAYGANAADPRDFPIQYHLPPELVGELAGAGAAGDTSMASDMCNCVGDTMTGGGGVADQLGGALASALNSVLPTLMSDLIDALLQVPPNQTPEEQATLRQLLEERSPAAIAKVAGYDVARFNKAGGGAAAQDLFTDEDREAFNANGQVYSDTASLLDRTLTSQEEAAQARHEQLLGIMTQVRDQLTERLLKPTLETGVTGGIEAISSATTAAMGQQIGTAAAPPIAQAVGAAVAANIPKSINVNSTAPPTVGESFAGAIPGLASGGAIRGPGSARSDSILARLSNGEYVLPASDVSRMGGFAGVEALRKSLPGYATGGGVVVNDVVGGEFFGVSEIPIIGLIVNTLVRILLAVLGVEIEARDTLDEMTNEFRDFRGDFQGFNASGRLLNDTSALVERSQTSEDLVAQERIRILKIVIQELIKYIIEKVIVPLAKAAANAALQAGAAAASTGINAGIGAAGAPGAGAPVAGLVSSLITGVGGAGVDVIAEVATDIAGGLTDTLIETVASGLTDVFPDISGSLFGGGGVGADIRGFFEDILIDPLLGIFGGFGGLISGIFAPLLGGAAGILAIGGGAGSIPFDNGGTATGTGLMPKATLRPERVLSPQQTQAFDRLVQTLTSGNTSNNSTVIHAPFTVTGSEQGGRQAHSKLLALMS